MDLDEIEALAESNGSDIALILAYLGDDLREAYDDGVKLGEQDHPEPAGDTPLGRVRVLGWQDEAALGYGGES